MEAQHGTIRKLVTDRGFGFIEPQRKTGKSRGQKGNDFFFHASGVESPAFDDLREGDSVSFSLEETEKGPKAVQVRRVA